MKAVIIAAGMGSRLWGTTNKTPKALLPLGKATILEKIITNIAKAGILEFVIIVGYESHIIRDYMNRHQLPGIQVEFVENPDWKRGNGISVLMAEKVIPSGNFILSMSDHVVSAQAVKRIAGHRSGKNLLLTDPNPDEVFDIDDATKVKLDGNRIIDIGKEISDYNAIDCGIFRLTSRYYDAIRTQIKNGRDSISGAVQDLIKNNDMNSVSLVDGEKWLDIDTLEAYQLAHRNLELFD